MTQAILILGMHRSGTSALTRTLNLLGMALAKDLLPAQADNNEAGFWESAGIHALNEEILCSGESSWDDWRSFNQDWYASDAAQGLKAKALEVLRRDVADAPLFVLKDPRICRLLPFWLDVLDAYGAEPKCILPVRNPLEVAESLKARDDFPVPKSAMIWLRHVLDAEFASRSLARVCVSYDDLLADWRRTADQIATGLGLSWPRDPVEAKADIDRFLDGRHRHHQLDDSVLSRYPELQGWVQDAYQALLAQTKAPENRRETDRLDQIRTEFDRAVRALGALYSTEQIRLDVEHALADKTARMQALEAGEQSWKKHAENLGEAVKSQTRQIESMRVELAKRAQHVDQVNAALAERNKDLDRVNAALAEKTTEASEQARFAAARSEEISGLKTRMSTLEQDLARAKSESEQRVAQLKEANQLGRHLLDTQLALRHKKVWRLYGALCRLERRHPSLAKALSLAPSVVWWTLTLQLRKRLRLERAAHRIRTSRIFDEAWYVMQYPDVLTIYQAPALHWLQRGWKEGRNPGPLFDTKWYLARNPDVAASGENPLLHYLREGARQGADPNPLFDSVWYLKRYPDIATGGMNPLTHYVGWGAKERRDPHPLFSTGWYLDRNNDIRDSGLNPLAHFIHRGGAEHRDPGPMFNIREYLEGHPEARQSGVNPLLHYLSHGHADRGPAGANTPAARDGIQAHLPLVSEDLGVSNRDFQPREQFAGNPAAFQPRVTVVVPNYNHEAYLRQRLDTIYGQDYPNFEVLLLDDCSTDGSRAVLEEYAARYPDKTRTLFNETNSGGPFGQWKKGIETAESELVWIAESDDYCDPHFLRTLVPFFMDEAVMLAYARSVFVDEKGAVKPFTFEKYLSELSADKWHRSYVATAHNEVAHFLGKKNTIPNVSSAVFRKCHLPQLFNDPDWLRMKICGDWIFYLHLLRGGKVAFSTATNNYFRFHSSNSSARTYSTHEYYREHEQVACDIARLYVVPDKTLAENRSYIRKFFDKNAVGLKKQGISFESVYDDERIREAAKQRTPNLLIAAFGLLTGGGEVFPVRLANAFRQYGYSVTFFDFRAMAPNPRIRAMLRPDIPLVERNQYFPGVEQLIEDFGIEVIHTHHGSVDEFFSNATYKESTMAKHVITMHGMYEMMSPKMFNAALKKVARSVDAWVYIADKNLVPFNTTAAREGHDFFKIPNGMENPEVVPHSRQELGIPEEAFVICLASRAAKEKGWREAVEITREARHLTDKDIHLLLLGDGPVHDEMSTETLPEFVHLIGFVPNVVSYYAMADIGILPTTFKGESFPLTVIECLMAGKPVIASKIGEVENMITAEDGAVAGDLIDIESGRIPVATTAQQVARLVSDAELYADKCRLAREIAPRFEMNNVVAQYAEVYAHVARSR